MEPHRGDREYCQILRIQAILAEINRGGAIKNVLRVREDLHQAVQLWVYEIEYPQQVDREAKLGDRSDAK